MLIDWDLINSVNLDELNDEKAESLYDQLIEYIPEDEDNVQRLKQLFYVCKSVMQIKALQADVAVEELEEMVKKRYDKNEIELLKKELEIYKQSETNGGDIAQKLSAANEQIYQLRNAIESKDNEIIKFKRRINDMQNSLDVKEKEVSALRSEVDSLREEVDNQRQIDEQIIERQEPIEKLREKNKQIQSLLDELRDIETVNLELANQVQKLKLELNTATNEIQLSCNQMEMLRQQIKELNQLNSDFVKERTFLQNEIKVLRDIIQKYENEDDSIADKFSEKVEQLRRLINLKDEEIMRLKSMSIFGNKNLANGQNEKHLNINIEIEERDKQIELLKSQLNEAVIDMESQTEIIHKLMLQNKGEEHVLGLNQQIVVLNNKLKCIEEEVQTKDEELLALRKRINLYERGEYGLKDALKEVNDLQKHLNNRDQRIEEMIQQINELQLKLNDAMDQIDLLSEGNLNFNSTTNKPNDKTKNLSRKDKIKFLEMQQQLVKLEEEKIALSEQLRLNFGKSTTDKEFEYQEINKLKNQLETLENENSELQLGMKEILNGIRESDSNSDVIIECPSLERVCQILESRSLSRDLSNIIVLKAELDLVRGHNEQLRTEMRKLRNDYLKVISQYTQDLLERETFVIQNNNKENNFIVSDTDDSNAFNQQFDPEVDEESDVAENESKESSDESEEDRTEPKQEDSVSLNNCIEITFVNQESQTLPINLVNDQIELKSDSNTDNYTQTDKNFAEISAKEENQSDLSAKKLCANCTKVLKIVDFLKNCVEKLEENIRSSEAKYVQHLNLLQQENKNLMESFNEKLNEKDLQLIKKEAKINLLENKIANQSTKEESSLSNEYEVSKTSLNKRPETRVKLSSSCKTVLESIINCLQARLEHKDESIKQYRNMLQEAKQNFENEMIKLIESNQENNQKSAIDFTKMIDNEELQSALQSCVNELENCKTELNARITQLEEELEKNNMKMKIYQNENEQLKMKRSAPNVQLKELIEQLREECKQKDIIINNLNKTIKDDRSMRAMSAVRKPKDEFTKKDNTKVNNDLFQEISNLKKEIETQKTTIKNLEILKWDYEKNLKEIKEQTKLKLKEKDNEISDLQKKLEKIKVRLDKNESERQLLQTKIAKNDSMRKNTFNKSTQINSTDSDQQEKRKLKQDLKKLRNDMKEMESEANKLKENLEIKSQIESELKILLQESLKREKLGTIHEENLDLDKQYETLLQENAQLKVELRMAEFEFSRQSKRS